MKRITDEEIDSYVAQLHPDYSNIYRLTYRDGVETGASAQLASCEKDCKAEKKQSYERGYARAKRELELMEAHYVKQTEELVQKAREEERKKIGEWIEREQFTDVIGGKTYHFQRPIKHIPMKFIEALKQGEEINL